jgi:large subunit ribosomal protein L1
MPQQGKRYRADSDGWDKEAALPLAAAIEKVKSFKKAKFDQSVDIVVHLGIDAKQADQLVRGALALPHGIGKSKRVIAFCRDDQMAAAKAAGAIEAGGDSLVKKVEAGWFDFDVAISGPDMMRVVSRLGKVLGPKGLMPSPKSGTVTPNIETAVREYAAGKIEFRNDANGNVHAVIGKHSFDAAKLVENAQSFIDNILRLKPSSAKGLYIKKVSVKATMTPGVIVQL